MRDIKCERSSGAASREVFHYWSMRRQRYVVYAAGMLQHGDYGTVQQVKEHWPTSISADNHRDHQRVAPPKWVTG